MTKHWFYEDFIREENPKFPSLPLKKFSAMLFHACPLLHQWSHDHEQAFNTFMQYKTRVPVCGAIMLNDTWEKCVLVKGWKSSSGWGFPKGKINESEPSHICAIREVLEETGYDLAGQLDPQDVIEMSIKEQKISLYIVAGIPEDYAFETKTRKEISKIEWFRLTDLPTWKRNKAAPGKFYLISPFIGALKAYINERKPRAGMRKTPTKSKNGTVAHTRQIHSRPAQNAGTNCDTLAQDSSSQSSSAENGGPYTPSPQYTAATPYQSSIAHVVDHPEGGATAMDSNLTRLLNSLSMSVSVPDLGAGDKMLPTAVSNEFKASVPPAPAPRSPSPVNSPPAREADWSSTVPKPLSQRPSDGGQTPSRSGSFGPRPLPDGLNLTSRSSDPSSSLSINPHQNGSSAVLSGPPSAASLTAPSISSATSSGQHTPSRRGSSTADISPYLSRPSAMPTSGKRLKQLALLETLADESDRMTPQLGNREPLPRVPSRGVAGYPARAPSRSVEGYSPRVPSRGIAGYPPRVPSRGVAGYPPPLANTRPYYAPAPSASVPPPSNDPDLRVIYSSNHGPAPPQGVPYPPQARPPPPPMPMYNNSFQVRPQTSQAMHPGLGIGHQGHTPGGPRAASMHQNQLLSLISGNGPQGLSMPPPGPPMGAYPSMYRPMGAYPVPGPPQPLQHPMALRGAPMSMPPFNMYPAQPPSAPAPMYDLPAGSVNSNLLSILNGRPATAAGNSAQSFN
ncbi:hypothetical protein HWV62_6611 [Athelia sp. TMB]|nr:hypothetical protein HWV62_6611 [Athelia sp. TMB]